MNLDFNLNSYNFELPPELIAERPVAGRHHSRLLVYKKSTGEITHTSFLNISEYIPEKSLMVFNETKVFPCRLQGKKSTGGKCELFILNTKPRNGRYHCLMKTTGKKKIGEVFYFPENLSATLIESSSDGTFWVEFNIKEIASYLEKHGSVPIPPYIRKGNADQKDREDYQTVFAKNTGSVAAPTAGLHFTDKVFKNLESKNIKRAFVTLHVGMGTFSPVKTEDIRKHQMHGESFHITVENLKKIKNNQNVFAVGTTSLR
ncbi:MAG: tRNA preQ1(34) S-adenosylmethionine ribosyltransferase-isomerase QueA, partial [Epsilonproteobacteria bacterium]